MLDYPESPTSCANVEEKFKNLHLEVGQNQTGSKVGDSGYMSFQGLPCTALTQQNVLELSSQIAETEIGVESISDSDDIEQNELYIKNSGKNDTSYDQKISLYDPTSAYNKRDSFSVGNMKLMESHIKANSIDESAMSVVSSVWGDDRFDLNWEVPSAQLLEHLSNAEKGSHRSEVQLR